MNKKSLLTMVVLMATILNGFAQSEPVFTAEPEINIEENKLSVTVSFSCEEEATIYVSVDGGNFLDAKDFGNELVYYRTGEAQYMEIFAYAQAEGKEPSDEVGRLVEVLPLERTETPQIQLMENHEYNGLLPMAYDTMIDFDNLDQDPETKIYYRIITQDIGDTLAEWTLYDGESLSITAPGSYVVEAYAVAKDKSPSEVTYCTFDILPVPVASPLAYAHHVDRDGLAIRITDALVGEGNDNLYGNRRDLVEVTGGIAVQPEHFYYQINTDSDEWIEYDGDFYLKEYGEYVIYAYSTNGDKTSGVTRSMVVYGPSGYTSQNESYGDIVHNGLVYYINTEDSTLRVADQYYDTYYFVNYPFIHPQPGQNTVIPEVIYSQECDYTVKEIGFNGLSGCVNVSIPSTVTYINLDYYPSFPWYVSNTLNQITVDAGNPVYDSRGGCNAVIETASNKLVMGSTSTIIPDGVTSIGSHAFAESRLTNIDFPPSVTSIGNYAFFLTALADVVIGNSITAIGEGAFYCCYDLKTVTIGNSVTSIGEYAFQSCDSLMRVTSFAINPPSADNSFINQYYENTIYTQATLFVPSESLEAYRAHEEWGRFGRIVPFVGAGPGDVNGDGKMSIGDVTGLIDVLLASGEMPAYCDVNGDGKVTIADVTALIDMLLNSN